MNTSFSKYVKQCKWGLSLDTAGSDYRAHQLARLLTTILGRLPGPSARLGGEPRPAARLEQPHSRSPHLYRRRLAGKCKGAGGWEGPLTLYFPPSEDGAARGWAGGEAKAWGGGSGTPALGRLGTPAKVTLRERDDLNSGQTQRNQDPKLRGGRPNEAEAWGKGRETHGFLEGVGSTRGWGRGGGWNLAEANSRHQLVQSKLPETTRPAPPSSPDSQGHVPALIKQCPVTDPHAVCLTRTRCPSISQ